jgi:hypothetical protein
MNVKTIVRALKAKVEYEGLDDEDRALIKELLDKNPELILEKPFNDLAANEQILINEIQAQIILGAFTVTKTEGVWGMYPCPWQNTVLVPMQDQLVEQIGNRFPKLKEIYSELFKEGK